MIDTLLTKIENVLEADFLFGAFLPTLAFLIPLVWMIADVIGIPVLITFGTKDSVQNALILAGAGIGTVGISYLVYGLRLLIFRLWSGTIEGPFEWYFRYGTQFYTKKFLTLRKESHRNSQWEQLGQWFREEVIAKWNDNLQDVPQEEFERLINEVHSLHEKCGFDKIKSFLKEEIIEAYKKYHGNGLMKNVYREIKEKLLDLAKQEQLELVKKGAGLDRRFGELSSIRATALGNAVESFNSYSYKRYGIEGEVFWPHLQHVLPDDFRGRIRGMRIFLDFFLTMATLGMFLAFLCIIFGPWLELNFWKWASIGLFAFLVSYNLYYKMAVFCAIQYGDLIRASFDLFRLDLLHQFFIEHPVDRNDELRKWEKLRDLLLTSQTHNYEIRKREP